MRYPDGDDDDDGRLQDVMRQLVGPPEDVGELSHSLQGSFVPLLQTVRHRK